MDLFGPDKYAACSSLLKYASVLLCFTNAMMTGKNTIEIKDAALLKAAMLATIVADLFLLFTQLYFIGVSIFCLVQLIYITRHSRYSKPHTKIYAAACTAFMASSFIAVMNSDIPEKALVLAACLYAFLTLCSLHTAFLTFKFKLYPKKNAELINAGLWLLMLCDLNIMLNNAIPGNPVSGILIWLFYVPSQLFLSYSARR